MGTKSKLYNDVEEIRKAREHHDRLVRVTTLSHVFYSMSEMRTLLGEYLKQLAEAGFSSDSSMAISIEEARRQLAEARLSIMEEIQKI